MLVGRSKLAPEEKERRAAMLKALRPGLKLVYTSSDYHEEEETPFGFHESGDEITLLFVIDQKPVIDSGTRKVAYRSNVWLVSSRYGLEEEDEYYLACMTEVKDASEG